MAMPYTVAIQPRSGWYVPNFTMATWPRARGCETVQTEGMMNTLSPAQQAMLDTYQQHLQAELTGDLDATMAAMTDDPVLCENSI